MRFDASQMLVLVESLYAAAADGSWPSALRAMLPHWRAGAGSILIQDDRIGAHEGLEPGLLDDYSRHFWRLDERREIARRRLGEVLTNSRMGLADATVERSAFYQDFSRHGQSFYALGLSFEIEGEVLSISLHRLKPQGEFSEIEVGALEQLKPHIVRAAHVSRRLLAAQQARDDMSAALEQMPSALVLLDARGRVGFVNRAARRILAQGDGLRLERDGLCAASPSLTARLREQVLRAGLLAGGSVAADGDGVLHLPRASGRPALAVLAVPLPARSLLSSATRSTVAVFVRDPAAQPPLPAARLARLYGLTPAEARLAAQLAQGRALEEVADALRVSRETVRSQLRAIFQKTGTRRQGELLQRLALDSVLLPTTDESA